MNDSHDAAVWFQLASLMGDPVRERYCLEQALKIDPEHSGARERLEVLLRKDNGVVNDPTTSETHQELHCSYVGLAHDSQSLAAYPSSQNYCYRLRDPKPVKLDYQQQFCLVIAHERCPIFLRAEKALIQPGKEKRAVLTGKETPATNPINITTKAPS